MKKKNANKKPDFSRISEATVRRGVRMLREGYSASHVMRTLGVSYPTALKWKHEFVDEHPEEPAQNSTAAKPAEVHTEPAEPPKRRTPEQVDLSNLIEQISEILQAGCEVTLSRDRDRFIARLTDMHRPAPVFTQNENAPLVLLDVIGKWKREREREAAGNGHTTAH